MRKQGLLFWFCFCLLVWLAHALGYLLHEYAHSFTAWILGWKSNPFDLTYGHLSVRNLLVQSDIDENVDYDPILAAGKGPLAAGIAVNGVLIGNGVFYLVSRRFYSVAETQGRKLLALFAFLWCLMNVGNFWSYVPTRTFATHADMARIASGLGISPWWIAVILGIPFSIAIVHFFLRLLPGAGRLAFSGDQTGQRALTVLCSFAMFIFYGGSGFRGYGSTSHWISVSSCCVLFPASLILCWPRTGSAAYPGSAGTAATANSAKPRCRLH